MWVILGVGCNGKGLWFILMQYGLEVVSEEYWEVEEVMVGCLDVLGGVLVSVYIMELMSVQVNVIWSWRRREG